MGAKKRINSYVKGRAFEQKVARLLTRRLGVEFHRVPRSGATATTKKLRSLGFHGDVFTESPKWKHLVIECKKRKTPVTLLEIFGVVKDGTLMSWVYQAWKQSGCAIEHGNSDRWVLFFEAGHNCRMFVVTQNSELTGAVGTYPDTLTVYRDKETFFVIAEVMKDKVFEIVDK